MSRSVILCFRTIRIMVSAFDARQLNFLDAADFRSVGDGLASHSEAIQRMLGA